MTDSDQDGPKLHIDSDWKAQAEAETVAQVDGVDVLEAAPHTRPVPEEHQPGFAGGVA